MSEELHFRIYYNSFYKTKLLLDEWWFQPLYTNFIFLEFGNQQSQEQPHIQGAVTAWVHEGWEGLLHFQGWRGCGEEIPLVQGKEQWLCFAGAAVKRYPTSKVRETQVRR